MKAKSEIKLYQTQLLRFQNRFKYFSDIEGLTEEDFENKLSELKKDIIEIDKMKAGLARVKKEKIAKLKDFSKQMDMDFATAKISEHYETHLQFIEDFKKTCEKLKEFLIIKKSALSLKNIQSLEASESFSEFIKNKEEIEVKDVLLDIHEIVSAVEEIDKDFLLLE